MLKRKTVQLKLVKKTSKSVENSQQFGTEEKVCISHFCRNDKDNNVMLQTEQLILRIMEAAFVKQSSSDDSEKLLNITDKLPVKLNASIHECHYWCYQSFTHISRLKRT